MAGVYDSWRAPDGSTLQSCTIITTDANSLVEPIHNKNRMPVILDPREYDLWLDPTIESSAEIDALLVPFDSAAMQEYAVQRNLALNNARCLEPYTESEGEYIDLFGAIDE